MPAMNNSWPYPPGTHRSPAKITFLRPLEKPMLRVSAKEPEDHRRHAQGLPGCGLVCRGREAGCVTAQLSKTELSRAQFYTLPHDARDVQVLEKKNYLAIYNSHSIAMTHEQAAFSLPLETLQAECFATLRNKPMQMLVSSAIGSPFLLHWALLRVCTALLIRTFGASGALVHGEGKAVRYVPTFPTRRWNVGPDIAVSNSVQFTAPPPSQQMRLVPYPSDSHRAHALGERGVSVMRVSACPCLPPSVPAYQRISFSLHLDLCPLCLRLFWP